MTNRGVSIKRIDNTHIPAYTQLASEFGTIFNSVSWIQLYGSNLEHYGIFDNDQKLIAAFYLYKTKMMGLAYYKNPPYTPHIGWCYKNKASNKANALTFDKNLISELADFMASLKGGLYTLAMPASVTDAQPFIWKKFKTIPNYTYHLDLRLSADELLQNMTADKRNSLKKAEKDQLQTQLTTDYAAVEQLILKTFSRKQKSIDAAFVKKILHTFANSENSFAFVTSLNGKPISAAFCIFDRTTCYYLLGGYDNENKHQGAGVSSIWNAILHAKAKGLTTFDFEGSMLPEVEKFFRGFGGNLIPYYTVNKALLPVEMLLKFMKREIF
jgi:lipid II:glycine glycyltransferase (peptidoglycan interpeptide bridge formation enzyme)